jgi:hypothetical protein
MVETWVTIVTSVGCAILSSLVTAFFTSKIEKKKQQREDKKEISLKNEKAYEARPRFEVTNYFDSKPFNKTNTNSSDLNVLVLGIKGVDTSKDRVFFDYNSEANEESNLVYYEYKLKNIGKTEIDYFTIASTIPKTVAVTNLETKRVLLNERFVYYEADCNKRFIKENDQVTIRIYYHKDEIIGGLLGAALCIYVRDINGRMWMQPLFAPTKEIENSTMISFKDYKASVDIDAAIDCFTGKSYW